MDAAWRYRVATRPRLLGSARLGRRRFLQLTAAGVGAVAVAGAARSPVAHAQFEELYRLARAEGQINLQGGGPAAAFLATARQFMAAFPDVTVNPDSSLGVEFSSSSVGGVLDGTSDSSKVTAIFNGDLCILR